MHRLYNWNRSVRCLRTLGFESKGTTLNFLCVCEMGQNRSVALTRILHSAGHAAIALGWRTADANAFAMLSQWAHHIIVVDDDFKWKVPAGSRDKVLSFHVGEDRWPSPIHPELHNMLKAHYTAWAAGDKDPGRSTALRERLFSTAKQTTSDINEHLDTLREYSEQSRTVLELGTRGGVSTTALLAGQPHVLFTVDINQCDMQRLQDVRGRTHLRVLQSDSRDSAISEPLTELDLLFVDTDHTFEQVSQELAAHATRVQKWIIFHDTIAFPPVLDAIKVFLASTSLWKMRSHAANNNGLLVIERIAPEPDPV